MWTTTSTIWSPPPTPASMRQEPLSSGQAIGMAEGTAGADWIGGGGLDRRSALPRPAQERPDQLGQAQQVRRRDSRLSSDIRRDRGGPQSRRHCTAAATRGETCIRRSRSGEKCRPKADAVAIVAAASADTLNGRVRTATLRGLPASSAPGSYNVLRSAGHVASAKTLRTI